ncbi:hypothetical protein HCN51_07950 [Nonomuraea sp. FMUSA5-5]|uniref:Uncharacterized protein n=1 Tax=Nonomuraea composti TaxID=2720023 RepID=A0ABX1AWS0_9ACTN|nr:hypothetical protein [Nonomuraea sp. FMUSA5-5]NJP89381.1 hypothetical protein [Nonomuraea sp. FMUSA5-5]
MSAARPGPREGAVARTAHCAVASNHPGNHEDRKLSGPVAVLLSGAAASRSGRRLATLAGLVAALLVAAVALHWALMAFSYFLLADCAGGEARLLPWMADASSWPPDTPARPCCSSPAYVRAGRHPRLGRQAAPGVRSLTVR